VSIEHYSLDDLHAQALNEFALDENAQHVLHAVYEAMQSNYIAALKLLRLRRASIPPWESAAS
jgi:hypothetical protein